MKIEIINERKEFWYYNRKGLVCKVMSEDEDSYTVKVWLNKNYTSQAIVKKEDCVLSDKKVFSKQDTINLVGNYLGWCCS